MSNNTTDIASLFTLFSTKGLSSLPQLKEFSVKELPFEDDSQLDKAEEDKIVFIRFKTI